ncbi:MAG: Holliday junction branch migration protein RuvA [Bacteroidales bacterium]
MYEFIRGKIEEITPAYVILVNNNVGYFLNITLNTYTFLREKEECSLYLHEVIREDAFILYGFSEKSEREVFRQLLSVSGIGANTSCMILSSLNVSELKNAIINEEVNTLKNIKGIGAKSAQRIIVDLKDKLSKEETSEEIFSGIDNTIKDEAFSALVTLGFNKKKVEKVLDDLVRKKSDIGVEELVKKALSKL